MVNPYLMRRQGRQAIVYPHPSLEPVLERTLGVPLFQEQLLRMAMITAGFSGGEAEELRRAFGFKRSERRMRDIEVKLREGMQRNGLSPEAQEQIIQSITSFALYGFPESHAASFALIAYASAYLKCHYLAAFTAALLNNQPMGFYSPATIVKDAQRHGLKVRPVDITRSDWLCTLEIEVEGHSFSRADKSSSKSDFSRSQPRREPFGKSPDFAGLKPGASTINDFDAGLKARSTCFALRMGFRYAKGLREEAAHAILQEREKRPFDSIADLAYRVPELRRNELVMLASIGALNSIGCDRDVAERTADPSTARPPDSPASREKTCGRSAQDDNFEERMHNIRGPEGAYSPRLHRRDALWQVERAARFAGPLLESIPESDSASPLARMTPEERLVADFHGTGLTVGPHPMAYRRADLQRARILSAAELKDAAHGQRVRTAGCVIARQRPGTAKGFVFLSLEDETGISNAIITPDILDKNRVLITTEKFLLLEGVLQKQEGVISVKVERVKPMREAYAVETVDITDADVRSHDFH